MTDSRANVKCRYCDEPRNEYAILRATGRPAMPIPKGTAWVCADCSYDDDWMIDPDMGAQS